jgi:porin
MRIARNLRGALFASSIVLTLGVHARAQTQPEAGASTLGKRETLTGDWFGAGPTLRDTGFVPSLSFTQFYQGLMSGDGPHRWDYGAKVDAFLKVDASKLGFWQGFGVSAHLEFNFGRATQDAGGVLLPVNSALKFPGANEAIADLALSVSQRAGEHVSLAFGKINMVDSYDAGHDFSGGRGIEQFQHLELVAPFTGIVPPMIFGGLVAVDVAPVKFTLIAFDPVDRTRQTGFDHAFETGVTFNASTELRARVAGQPGKLVAIGAYSTQDGFDFRSIPDIIVPSGTALSNTERKWYTGFSFEQALWHDASDERKSWGLFGQVGLSDGNPNPQRWMVMGGVGGRSPVPGRSADRFGVGGFYVGLSRALKDGLRPIVRLGNEYGGELFYNYAPAPWVRLTTDLQVLRPAPADNTVAFVGGLRAQVVF